MARRDISATSCMLIAEPGVDVWLSEPDDIREPGAGHVSTVGGREHCWSVDVCKVGDLFDCQPHHHPR